MAAPRHDSGGPECPVALDGGPRPSPRQGPCPSGRRRAADYRLGELVADGVAMKPIQDRCVNPASFK